MCELKVSVMQVFRLVRYTWRSGMYRLCMESIHVQMNSLSKRIGLWLFFIEKIHITMHKRRCGLISVSSNKSW